MPMPSVNNDRVIYKYEIKAQDEVQMLRAGKIVHVVAKPSNNYSEIIIWVEHRMIDLEDDKGPHLWVKIVGTGHIMPDGMSGYYHRGTVLNGPFVWHVYQQVN